MCSVSDDSVSDELSGGGRLHIWRPTELLAKPVVEALNQLEMHRKVKQKV